MCKYCKNVVTGNDCEDLIQYKIPIGDFVVMDIGTYLGERHGKPLLRLNAIVGTQGSEVETPVKFCPMCGTDLEYALIGKKS